MELENGVMNVQETSENAGGQELEQGVASPDVQNVEAEENSVGEESAEAGQAQEAQIPNDVWKTARLRAEREAATRYARQQAQQDAMVAARFGHLKVPGTDRNIRTVKDYFDALDAQNKAQTASRLKAANIDPKIIDRAVAENPIVQKAAQVVEQAQRDAGDRILKRQLEEITKIDPAVKTLEDIRKMDTFPQFDALVRSGVPLDVAYKATNFERLSSGKATAAKQAAINAAKGKSHLGPTTGTGKEKPSLTEEEYESWANLGFSRKEAEQYHKQFNS